MPSIPPERVIDIRATTILKVIAIIGILAFLFLIRDILALLIVAVFIAGLLHPAARWGARHHIPKGLTVICIYLLALLLLAIALLLIIPALLPEINHLLQRIGSSVTILTGAGEYLEKLTNQYGFGTELSSNIGPIQDQVMQLAAGLPKLLRTIFGSVIGGVFQLGLILVMAFYMVVEEADATRLFKNLVPDPYQEKSAQILLTVEEKMGRWLSGQLVLSLIIGVMYYIGMLILGLDSALALAFFAGFMEFIPYLGPILGGIPILLIAFSISPLKALFALVLVIIIQQLENQIVVPKVMQRAVGLNPLVSIVAVLVGAQLFGIVGALLAIPVATAISVVLSELYK